MELEITRRNENVHLKRTEVEFKVSYDKADGINRDKIRDKIAFTLSVPKELVVVNHLNYEFGRQNITGYAKVYRNKEETMKNERQHILVRNKLAQAEAKGEKKAAPAKKEDAPAAPAPAAKAEKKPEAKPAAAEKKEEKK